MTPTLSPSKLVRSAILTAFAGVISIGISPGTLGIVLSGISPSLGELVGLTGVLSVAPDPQPAVNISSRGDTASARAASFSGLLTGPLLVHAASDAHGLPAMRFASADATANGLSASPASPTGGSLLSFGAPFLGFPALANGHIGAPTRSVATSLAGASLSVAGTPIAIAASPAIDSGNCSDKQETQQEHPQEDSTEALHGSDWCGLKVILNEQILSGDGVGSGRVTVNDDFPLGNAGMIDVVSVNSNSPATVTPAQEIPAPATLLLLLAGVPGLLLLRRRGRPTAGSTG